MDFTVLYLLTFSILLIQDQGTVQGDVLPTISWDPFNPLFNCSGSGHNHPVINVHLFDSLTFVCPHKALTHQKETSIKNHDSLYENAFLLSGAQKNAFSTCNASDGRPFMVCDKPTDLRYFTFMFKEISGSSNGFIFKPGHDYFIIGTGKRRKQSLEDRIGGSCLPGSKDGGYPLKLQIHVCSWKEIKVFRNCTVCSSPACYLKGCSSNSKWNHFGTYRRVDNLPPAPAALSASSVQMPKGQECVEVLRRSRHNHGLGMTFVDTKLETILCPLEDFVCTRWEEESATIYKDTNGSCFELMKRHCSLRTATVRPMLQTIKRKVPCGRQLTLPVNERSNSSSTLSLPEDKAERVLYVLVLPITLITCGFLISLVVSLYRKRRTMNKHASKIIKRARSRLGSRKDEQDGELKMISSNGMRVDEFIPLSKNSEGKEVYGDILEPCGELTPVIRCANNKHDP